MTTTSLVRRIAVWLAPAALSLSGQATAAEVVLKPDVPAEARAFVERHCLDCHSMASPEGGLDFESLSTTLSSPEIVERWTSAFDRAAAGEMPPESEERPPANERDAFLASLASPLALADRAHREVVQRRLNRVEYENSVRDLLGVSLDLKDRLPADQEGGGFDNDGAALATSPELLQLQYELAREAIDAALGNLFVSMLQDLGLEEERFGSGTATLRGLS